jgi:hypothetical protein
MLEFLLYYKTAWNDHFPAANPTNLSSQTYTERQTPSAANVYVSNCLFKSISSTNGNGGALCCTSATYFLVESTSFFSCRTSYQEGGAVYFSNTGSGQSVLYEVCGYDCCSTYSYNPWFQFARINVYNVASSKNHFNYSSITRCVSEESRAWYTLRLDNGNVCCPSSNISLNKCYGRNGIFCTPFYDFNSVTCSLSYSSFTDNIDVGYTCIFFYRGGANYEIKSCNILRNTQSELNAEGTIYTDGNLMIGDSCILENTATYIFYVTSSSYTITLSNCTIDKTKCNQNIITQNTVTKSFILALNHMSTRNCHSGYDSAGYLSPIIQTPSSSKKQKNYYSCRNFIYQCRLSDFFSFNSIFLFNFIHSDVSI